MCKRRTRPVGLCRSSHVVRLEQFSYLVIWTFDGSWLVLSSIQAKKAYTVRPLSPFTHSQTVSQVGEYSTRSSRRAVKLFDTEVRQEPQAPTENSSALDHVLEHQSVTRSNWSACCCWFTCATRLRFFSTLFEVIVAVATLRPCRFGLVYCFSLCVCFHRFQFISLCIVSFCIVCFR